MDNIFINKANAFFMRSNSQGRAERGFRRKAQGSFKKWELALLIAVSAALIAGVWAGREQGLLASKLIRLHVIAESDEPEAQAEKLLVRDRVLKLLEPELLDVRDVDEAIKIIEQKLPEIEIAAAKTRAERGNDTAVRAELSRESYPTRVYESFSLPAGEYNSLRISLGAAEGKNWWCVVFPPLCAQAAGASLDADALKTLNEDDVALISGNDEGYVVKFKILELWGELRNMLAKN